DTRGLAAPGSTQRRPANAATSAVAVSAAAAPTGADTPNPSANPAAPSAGPAAAPTFNAAVAYEPPIVGAPVAAYSTSATTVPPTANAEIPCARARTNRAAGEPANTMSASHPASSNGPPTASTTPGCRSDIRPAIVTPRNDPTPKSTSTTETHTSPSPADSVTSGATKVKAANVPPLTSAPTAMASASPGSRSCRSSAASAGTPPSPAAVFATPRRIPTAAGTHSRPTAQNVARHPSAAPTRAPAGTPPTMASVVPESRTATARPLRSSATRFVAVASATARKPAFASAATTRPTSTTANTDVTAEITR